VKHLCLLTLGLLFAAGVLHAQVAVPSMVPARPEVLDPGMLPLDASFTPENPAAMQWGTPSQVAYGVMEAEVRHKDFPNDDPDDFRGTYGGFRWVGQRFSLAAEDITLKDREPYFDIKQNTNSVALAFRYDDGLAFGLETGRSEDRHFFPGAPIPPPDPSAGKTEVDRTTIGVSFRFWERLFLGIAQTRESWMIAITEPPPAFRIEQSRVVEKYGLGLRAGTTYRIHAEYDVISKEPFEGPGEKHQEEEREVAVLELKVWNFLVAGRATTIRHLRERTPNTEIKAKYDVMAMDYGWAPDDGLAIMVHLSKSKIREHDFDEFRSPDQFISRDLETRSAAASVTWLF